MICRGCAGLSYCQHPWRDCDLKTDLRLLDVLRRKQKRIEEMELAEALRLAREKVKR